MSPSPRQEQSAQIASCTVSIVLGDIAQQKADAYIIPEYPHQASWWGVAGVVSRAGGERGVREYEATAQSAKLRFGEVVATEAGGGNAAYLLHVVSLNSVPDEAKKTVYSSTLNALHAAADRKLSSVAAPALGTGAMDNLKPDESARAMLAAIAQFAKGGGALQVSIVIYNDRAAFSAFWDCLTNKTYHGAPSELSLKEFKMSPGARDMLEDHKLNQRHEAEEI